MNGVGGNRVDGRENPSKTDEPRISNDNAGLRSVAGAPSNCMRTHMQSNRTIGKMGR